MRIKITQYGLSMKALGWDGVGDSGTDAFQGDHGNVIQNGISCALTASAVALLGAKHGDYLQIVFPNGFTYIRRYDDTAPEADPRLDMFNAYEFDKQMDAAGHSRTFSSFRSPATPTRRPSFPGDMTAPTEAEINLRACEIWARDGKPEGKLALHYVLAKRELEQERSGRLSVRFSEERAVPFRK